MLSRPEYGARFVRFVLVDWHREAYLAAYFAPDSRSSKDELQRLHRELATLPPRHSCSCRCVCMECQRLRAPKGCTRHANGYVPGCEACNDHQVPHVEIGRTSPVNAPMPSAMMLDLAWAMSILGRRTSAGSIARWLSAGQVV